MRPKDTAKIFPFLAPLKGQLYTFRIRSSPNSPVEVCYSEKKLKHTTSFDRFGGTGSATSDNDDTTADKAALQIVTTKLKPTLAKGHLSDLVLPKSPDRTESRSSTSSSSNFSHSPRPRSKASTTSLQSIRQDSTTTTAVTTTTAAVSSKRLARKGLDVSPATLEFFGMKSLTGPNACFQFIEEREPPPSKKKSDEEVVLSTSGAGSGVDRSDEMVGSEDGNSYVRHLGEPGPEHFPGTENSKNKSGDGYAENLVQITMNGRDREKKVEFGQMRKRKTREELRRLAKNGSEYDYQQNYEPGPEYSSNIGDGEDGTSKAEDEEVLKSNDSPILAIGGAVVRDVSPARDIAEEGGGTAEGLSTTLTMYATVDGTRGVTEAATPTTETTVPVGGISMDSGNGGTFATILIKGVQIVNDDSIQMADVLIQDGIIR